VREELSISAINWLNAKPIVVADAASVLATFQSPAAAKVVKFSGPHTLYRAGGWDTNKGKLASAYGSWWADELVLARIGSQLEKFETWLPPEMLKQAWPSQYRGVTALCEDWNDMREMFKMKLPAGETIEGLVGPTAPQPQRSKMNPKARNTPMLRGGAEQVFFKRSETLSRINPLWVYSTKLW
jgi:hypothetical protein